MIKWDRYLHSTFSFHFLFCFCFEKPSTAAPAILKSSEGETETHENGRGIHNIVRTNECNRNEYEVKRSGRSHAPPMANPFRQSGEHGVHTNIGVKPNENVKYFQIIVWILCNAEMNKIILVQQSITFEAENAPRLQMNYSTFVAVLEDIERRHRRL